MGRATIRAVARIAGAFLGLLPMLLLVPSCDEGESCCYEGIADYCARESCPRSLDEMLEDACFYRDIYYDGDRLAVGINGGGLDRLDTLHALSPRLRRWRCAADLPIRDGRDA